MSQNLHDPISVIIVIKFRKQISDRFEKSRMLRGIPKTCLKKFERWYSEFFRTRIRIFLECD